VILLCYFNECFRLQQAVWDIGELYVCCFQVWHKLIWILQHCVANMPSVITLGHCGVGRLESNNCNYWHRGGARSCSFQSAANFWREFWQTAEIFRQKNYECSKFNFAKWKFLASIFVFCIFGRKFLDKEKICQLKALAVNLSRPSGRLGLYASLIGPALAGSKCCQGDELPRNRHSSASLTSAYAKSSSSFSIAPCPHVCMQLPCSIDLCICSDTGEQHAFVPPPPGSYPVQQMPPSGSYPTQPPPAYPTAPPVWANKQAQDYIAWLLGW